MPKDYEFQTDCVHSTAEAINAMTDAARDVSLRTMRRHCDLSEFEESLGYFRNSRQGLTLAGDWAISYHKSTYRGRPCYYLCHSCIEYIWTKEPQRKDTHT